MNGLFICKKKATVNTIAFWAPPQGLEPWTYGLTVRRSNQLSYGGKIVFHQDPQRLILLFNKTALIPLHNGKLWRQSILFFKSDRKDRYLQSNIPNILKIILKFLKKISI